MRVSQLLTSDDEARERRRTHWHEPEDGEDPVASVDPQSRDGASSTGGRERIVELANVSRTFGEAKKGHAIEALRNVSFSISRGEFVCLLGPSGCGKSTVLNMLAGLLEPSSGTVIYDGTEVTNVNTRAGYITQSDTLLPWRTTEKNVRLGLEFDRSVTRKERKYRVQEVLRLVGLSRFAKHYPSQLSGGMRKRAILARTLVYEPETLLMDEPFGALDAQLRTDMQAELLKLWQEKRGTTVIFVTHDLEEAILLADRILMFGTQPGRVIAEEQISLARPRDVARLRGTDEFTERWRRLREILEIANRGGQEQ